MFSNAVSPMNHRMIKSITSVSLQMLRALDLLDLVNL